MNENEIISAKVIKAVEVKITRGTGTVNDFLDCYEDAHASIIRFLTGLESDFSPSLLNGEERISFAEGIRDYYQDLSDIEKNLFDSIMKDRSTQSVSVRFINFNYTTILDKCINLILHKPLINNNIRKMTIDKNILHIHGNLQHYPVIGLNDESQIANKELLKSSDFVRTVIKKENISYCGEMTYSKAEKLIENSRIICIWGMSLGDTDADWWKLICKVLLRDGTRHVIIFCYKEDPPNEVSIVKTLRIKEPIKNRLLSFSSITDVQKNSIIDRIHVVINTQKVLKLPTPET